MGVRKFIKRLFTFRWARDRKKPYPTRTDVIGVRGSLPDNGKNGYLRGRGSSRSGWSRSSKK